MSAGASVRKADPRVGEYLRRNLLHASATGAFANALATRTRVLTLKRPPAWLVKALDGIIDRVRPLPDEMAAHRDEVNP